LASDVLLVEEDREGEDDGGMSRDLLEDSGGG
jgi:hypothetical protein